MSVREASKAAARAAILALQAFRRRQPEPEAPPPDAGWPSDIPFDPKRKRYYFVEPDLTRNPSDFELLNTEELYNLTNPFPDGTRYPIRTGRYSFQLEGRRHPDSYGLPTMLTRPRLFVARRNKPLDAYGFSELYVSSRARDLLRSVDPDAFEFAECETLSRRSIKVEPYWMVAIKRPVDGFDETRSVFDVARGFDGVTGEPFEGPHFAHLFDIHMRPDLPEDFHAFFFPRFQRTMVFDRTLVEAWKAARLSGWMFTPLQPPSPRERRANMYSPNFMYWYKAQYRDRIPGQG